MSTAGLLAQDLTARDGKPSYVQFYVEPRQLIKESEIQGRYVAVDVEMVKVCQVGSSDSVIFKVAGWLAQNKIDAANGRLPYAHAQAYEEMYQRWKVGQEDPVTGTPIKSWPVASPAQVETMLRLGVRTVEDLSTLSSEGLAKVGMGAVDLKNKAMAWIAASEDKGKLSQEMAALQRENDSMKSVISKMTEQMVELKGMVRTQPVQPEAGDEEVITAADLIEDEAAPVRNRKK